MRAHCLLICAGIFAADQRIGGGAGNRPGERGGDLRAEGGTKQHARA